MALMTAQEYVESLRKLNTRVYMFGEKIENWVDHPMIRPSINCVAMTYALAQDPQYADLMTVKSSLTGHTINRFTHLHQSTEDLINKVKMQRLLGQKTASCFQRCVGMDAFNAVFSTTYEIDEKYGTRYHENFKKFLTFVQDNDLTVDGAMTDPKGDRSKAPHDQADPDMKALHRLALKVSHECERLRQFVRLQKAADGTYFAAATPEHDALPLSLDYFTDRFADQRWLIYDRRRDYGYYYDGRTARRVTLEDDRGMIADKLADRWLAEDERQFQLLWKNYFRALAIPQRINERQQRRMMPRRYWKHLTEME